jgi:hypothetical protein
MTIVIPGFSAFARVAESAALGDLQVRGKCRGRAGVHMEEVMSVVEGAGASTPPRSQAHEELSGSILSVGNP